MAKDVIARLKADTSQWDSGLAKATRSLNKFRQDNMSLDAALQGSVKTLTSVAAKYVGWGAAVTGAMKVAKDAFMSSESQADAWGRTMEASKTIYESFVTSLNNGSFSGWMSNMDNLITKARQAYDAIDDLNTKMTIINPERVKIQGKITEQKEIIRKNGKDSDVGKAAAEEIKRLEPQLKATYKQEAKMNYNAFETEVQKKLAEAGINLDKNSYNLLMRSFSSSKDYEKLIAGAKSEDRGTGTYALDENGHAVGQEITETWKNTNQKLLDLFTDEWRMENSPYLTASYSARNASYMVGIQDARYTTGGKGGSGGKTTKQEEVFGAGELGALEKQIQDLQKAQKHASSTEEWKAYEEQIKQINAQIDFLKTGIIQLPTIKPKFDKAASDELKKEIQSAGIFSTSSLSALKSSYQDTANNAQIGSRQQSDAIAMVADITAFENIRAKFQELGMQMGNDVTNNLLQKIGSGEGVEDADWQTFIDSLNTKIEEIGGELQPIKLDVNTGNIENVKKSVVGLDKNVNGVATAFTAMGNALNQIEDPGAKVAGYIASAIGQTAAAFGTAQTQAATMGPWAWIAFAATGLATMVSTIVGIKNATKFADGGLVKGTSYVGDKVPIMANAGELVLSASMQQNLADNLEARELTTGGESIIRGEDLVTIINNYGRRSARGEILR